MSTASELIGMRRLLRSDITSYLYHMIKRGGRDENTDPFDTLCKILKCQCLLGSGQEAYIQGNRRVVCFQDVPLKNQVENYCYYKVLEDEYSYNQYSLYGLGFSKSLLYKLGCRPVFYETVGKATKILDKDEHWRIVHLSLEDQLLCDWTHEREWRLPVEEYFKFELNNVVVIVPNKKDLIKLKGHLGDELYNRIVFKVCIETMIEF